MMQEYPQVDKHKVVVLSTTYNQSKYIEETLNGFAIQKTNFPFLCCVFDDASNDGEQKVLRNWVINHCRRGVIETYDSPLATILMATDRDNCNCKYVFYLQKINTWRKPEKDELLDFWKQHGEYIAFCEGDDYWIDPLKLQKQVDFLDANPEYAMVYSKSKQLIQNTNSFGRNSFGKPFRSTKELLLENSIPTPSVLYRRSIYDWYIKDIKWEDSRGWLMGDYPMWLFFSLNSKVQFMDEDMVVYRILDNSASHSTSFLQQEKFIHSTFEIKRFFNSRYSILPQYVLDNQMCKCLIINAIRFGEGAAACDYMKSFKSTSIKLKAYYALYKCRLLWIYNLCKGRVSF